MTHQLLHDFELGPNASQKRRVSMSEGMPANPFFDPDSFRNRSDNGSKNRLTPIWMTSAIMLIGEHPVVPIAIVAAVTPLSECLGKNRMHGHWLLRCFRLASPDNAISDGARHAH